MKNLLNIDCFEWLANQPQNSIHAVCTDPPYGLVEFSEKEVAKLRSGQGGIWRIPPEFDGKKRRPLPRFSVLTIEQKRNLEKYFMQWAELLTPSLVPGAHVIVASNPVLSAHVYHGLLAGGLEPRATIMRVYHGFRGGDRPKNAEEEFSELCVSPRGNYEPWLLFRRPISEKTVAQNLRKWGAGALKMMKDNRPVPDVIPSSKTPNEEREITDHPSLKPQHLLRFFCRMLLPSEGTLLDPFMGSGSTIAACEALDIPSIGLEIDEEYFKDAERVIAQLSILYPRYRGETLEMDAYRKESKETEKQPLLLEDPSEYLA